MLTKEKKILNFEIFGGVSPLMKMDISSKSKDLNKKMTTVDIDIAKGIDPKVNEYILPPKKNQKQIFTHSPKGLYLKQARANLMFMAQVERIFKDQGGL